MARCGGHKVKVLFIASSSCFGFLAIALLVVQKTVLPIIILFCRQISLTCRKRDLAASVFHVVKFYPIGPIIAPWFAPTLHICSWSICIRFVPLFKCHNVFVLYSLPLVLLDKVIFRRANCKCKGLMT